MRVFIAKILLFLGVLTVALFLLSISARLWLRHGDFYKLNPTTRTIILGHSQTECGLNDSLISHAQNFSQGGEAYFYTYLKLQKLLDDNKGVKNVLLSYANNQIDERMDKWIWGAEYMYQYYPKYSCMMNGSDLKLLLSGNPKTLLNSETKFLREAVSFAISRKSSMIEDRNWGGYLYLEREKVDSLLGTNYLNEQKKLNFLSLSKSNILYLNKIKSLCKQRGVNLFLIRMPVDHRLPFLVNEKQYQEVRLNYFPDLPYWDFKDYPIPVNELGDFDHLNHLGARRFSAFLNEIVTKGLMTSKKPQTEIEQAFPNIPEPK